MSKYAAIDAAIIAAIKADKNPLYAGAVSSEAYRIAEEKRCPAYRVIDRRMQALRKSGVIAFKRWADYENKRWGVVKPTALAKDTDHG